jgi:hypothetical protein
MVNFFFVPINIMIQMFIVFRWIQVSKLVLINVDLIQYMMHKLVISIFFLLQQKEEYGFSNKPKTV